jgi:23S rRNA (adenine2503-C2)-methyltransferase
MDALLGKDEAEIREAVREAAPEPFRGKQVATWVYDRRAASFDEMTDLPKALRAALAARFAVGQPKVVERTPAPDEAEKFLFELADGARVESVFMRQRKASRATVCVSSQAGCAVDCVFCVTGRMGAGRNLTAGEIVGQLLAVSRAKGVPAGGADVVFMGMGEPLLNIAAVEKALDLLERELSPRRITLSTAGIVPGIDALGARPRRPNLAVSLTAATDEVRSRLMPVNLKWPLAELMAALKRWPLEPGRRVTFEVVLIAGENDRPADARALVRLARKVPSKVNLIPLNESEEWLAGMKRPGRETIDAFAKVLAEAGVPVTVRWSKGLEAAAACGQLKGRVTPRRTRAAAR